MRWISKVRGRTLDEARTRARQALGAWFERSGYSADAREPSDADLLRQLRPGIASSPVEFCRTLRARQILPFAAFREIDATVHTLHTRFPAVERAIVSTAENALHGSFDLLGLTGVRYPDPIDWHFDPLSGKRAPLHHWTRIPFLDSSVVGDHKAVWEVNRHQHFVTLGQAYQLTGDERFARGFVAHISSWMDANPPKQGINWISSLEIAFRSIAWLWALALFRTSPSLADDVVLRMVKLLHLNARHLEQYLSTYFSPNTHLTGEALGLLYIGAGLPELASAQRWRDGGTRILVRELQRQVRPDGVYFEQSSWYHRYTADFYLHLLLLADATGMTLPDAVRQTTERLCEHLRDLQRPDGRLPLLGDDDGGRLLSLGAADPKSAWATLSVAAAHFGRPDLAPPGGEGVAEAVWLLGPDAIANQPGGSGAPVHLSRGYSAAGFFIMRDGWGEGASHAVIDCGPHGSLSNGHAHADALSIELSVEGRPIFVDAGTFTYVGRERNEFRSSLRHNTLTVDHTSQSEPAAPFKWATVARAAADAWVTHPRFDYFSGTHDGYARLESPAIHRRSVLFIRNGYWAIVDHLVSEGRHGVSLAFHCADDVTATGEPNGALLESSSSGAAAARVRVATFGEGGRSLLAPTRVSPAYAAALPATALRYEAATSGRARMTTFVLPQTFGVDSLAVDARASGYSIRSGAWVDTIVVAEPEGGSVAAAGIAADASLLWVHAPSGGAPTEIIAVDAAVVEVDGQRCTPPAGRQWVHAHRNSTGWTFEHGSMMSGEAR